MKSLSEPIARKANDEDKVSGRFWQGRFKSQALLSEKSILAAMAYVDLNPVRAKIASNIATSRYTSVKMRNQQLRKNPEHANQPLVLTQGLGCLSKLNASPDSGDLDTKAKTARTAQ